MRPIAGSKPTDARSTARLAEHAWLAQRRKASYICIMSSLSRFNPKTGIVDFWEYFRRPNPLRIPILLVSMLPFAVIFAWLSSETVYLDPPRPEVTYITTYAQDRSEEEIAASNRANQEIKALREAEEARIAERKREIYKALGAASGMDVDAIAKEADEERAAEQAAEEARRAELFGRTRTANDTPGGDSSP